MDIKIQIIKENVDESVIAIASIDKEIMEYLTSKRMLTIINPATKRTTKSLKQYTSIEMETNQ